MIFVIAPTIQWAREEMFRMEIPKKDYRIAFDTYSIRGFRGPENELWIFGIGDYPTLRARQNRNVIQRVAESQEFTIKVF